MPDSNSVKAKEFLRLALDRWESAKTAEDPQRTEGLTDQRFLNLEQWDESDEYARGDRPTLVIDQIGEPYRQLIGRQKSAKPALLAAPVDDQGDVDTADIFQRFIRHIENKGHAKAARDEAFKGAAGIGWGYYRIVTEFENEGDQHTPLEARFDQTIRYQAIEDPMTVYRDPSCPLHEPEKCLFSFHIEDISKAQFDKLYPEAISSQDGAFQATGLESPEWFPEEAIRVADYFYVETKDGPEVALIKGPEGQEVVVLSNDIPPGAEVVQRRKMQLRTVKLAKITGGEILEGNTDKTEGREWPGQFIPIIPVWGESLVAGGKRTLRGIVRAARDSQKMYNYHNSELVYELALAPKSKVLAAVEAVEGLEDMWKKAAQIPFPALLTKAFDDEGRPLPAPKVAQFTDPAKIQSLVIAINQAKTDLRSTTGWYDATDPNRRNAEQSGRAIMARKEAQAEGSVNYQDQFSLALVYEGMVLLDLIPKIYTRRGRVLRLVGLEDEEQTSMMTLGEPYKGKQGIDRIYAWGTGKYDVVANIGVSYATRRQEASSVLVNLMKVLPEPMAAAIAPMAVKNMDGPGMRDVAKILKQTLPKELRGDEENEGQPQIPPEVQKQMQQAQQLIDQLTEKVNQLMQAQQVDQVKAQAVAQQSEKSDAARLQIAQLGLQADQAKAALEAQQAERSDAVKLQIAQIGAEAGVVKIRADLILKLAEMDASEGKTALQEETKRLMKLADLVPPSTEAVVPEPPTGLV